MEWVALDFDGVLADTHSTTVDLYNKYNGTDVSVEEFTDWDFGDTPIVLEDYLMLSNIAWKLDSCGDVDVRPIESNSRTDFLDIVEPLSVNSDVMLDIVTARTKDNYHEVRSWIEYWYGTDWFNSLVFEKDKASLGYDIYIDDNPEMVNEVSVQYMPERPWNRTVEIEHMTDIYRMDTLESIVTDIQENRL